VKTKALQHILYDARFIKSIEILNKEDQFKAIYMVRLTTKLGLALAKKYVGRLGRFKLKMRNHWQY